MWLRRAEDLISSTLSRSSSAALRRLHRRRRLAASVRKGVEQREPGRRLARWRRLFVIGCRWCGGGFRAWRARRRGRLGRCGVQRRLAAGGAGAARAGSGAISAMLPAAIRTPWLPSAKSNREQPQVASTPGAAPKPCSRSSRIAPLAGNRPASRAICRRCGSAGPKVFAGKRCGIGRAEHPRRRPDWPTGSACRRPTTAMRAGRSSRGPPAADRRPLAPEIPHHSSRLHDRPASKFGRQNRTAPRELTDRQYRKRGAAGPRPGRGPHAQSGG